MHLELDLGWHLSQTAVCAPRFSTTVCSETLRVLYTVLQDTLFVIDNMVSPVYTFDNEATGQLLLYPTLLFPIQNHRLINTFDPTRKCLLVEGT